MSKKIKIQFFFCLTLLISCKIARYCKLSFSSGRSETRTQHVRLILISNVTVSVNNIKQQRQPHLLGATRLTITKLN